MAYLGFEASLADKSDSWDSKASYSSISLRGGLWIRIATSRVWYTRGLNARRASLAPVKAHCRLAPSRKSNDGSYISTLYISDPVICYLKTSKDIREEQETNCSWHSRPYLQKSLRSKQNWYHRRQAPLRTHLHRILGSDLLRLRCLIFHEAFSKAFGKLSLFSATQAAYILVLLHIQEPPLQMSSQCSACTSILLETRSIRLIKWL